MSTYLHIYMDFLLYFSEGVRDSRAVGDSSSWVEVRIHWFYVEAKAFQLLHKCNIVH